MKEVGGISFKGDGCRHSKKWSACEKYMICARIGLVWNDAPLHIGWHMSDCQTCHEHTEFTLHDRVFKSCYITGVTLMKWTMITPADVHIEKALTNWIAFAARGGSPLS